MLIANLNLVRVVALPHTASQSKWKDSMANAVAHLWAHNIVYDEFSVEEFNNAQPV